MSGQVEIIFDDGYTHHSTKVAGEFTNWQQVDLGLDSGTQYAAVFEGAVPGKTYSYKYVIDGQWRLLEGIPTVSDSHGNINHTVEAVAIKEPSPTPSGAIVDDNSGVANNPSSYGEYNQPYGAYGVVPQTSLPSGVSTSSGAHSTAAYGPESTTSGPGSVAYGATKSSEPESGFTATQGSYGSGAQGVSSSYGASSAVPKHSDTYEYTSKNLSEPSEKVPGLGELSIDDGSKQSTDVYTTVTPSGQIQSYKYTENGLSKEPPVDSGLTSSTATGYSSAASGSTGAYNSSVAHTGVSKEAPVSTQAFPNDQFKETHEYREYVPKKVAYEYTSDGLQKQKESDLTGLEKTTEPKDINVNQQFEGEGLSTGKVAIDGLPTTQYSTANSVIPPAGVPSGSIPNDSGISNSFLEAAGGASTTSKAVSGTHSGYGSVPVASSGVASKVYSSTQSAPGGKNTSTYEYSSSELPKPTEAVLGLDKVNTPGSTSSNLRSGDHLGSGSNTAYNSYSSANSGTAPQNAGTYEYTNSELAKPAESVPGLDKVKVAGNDIAANSSSYGQRFDSNAAHRSFTGAHSTFSDKDAGSYEYTSKDLPKPSESVPGLEKVNVSGNDSNSGFASHATSSAAYGINRGVNSNEDTGSYEYTSSELPKPSETVSGLDRVKVTGNDNYSGNTSFSIDNARDGATAGASTGTTDIPTMPGSLPYEKGYTNSYATSDDEFTDAPQDLYEDPSFKKELREKASELQEKFDDARQDVSGISSPNPQFEYELQNKAGEMHNDYKAYQQELSNGSKGTAEFKSELQDKAHEIHDEYKASHLDVNNGPKATPQFTRELRNEASHIQNEYDTSYADAHSNKNATPQFTRELRTEAPKYQEEYLTSYATTHDGAKVSTEFTRELQGESGHIRQEYSATHNGNGLPKDVKANQTYSDYQPANSRNQFEDFTYSSSDSPRNADRTLSQTLDKDAADRAVASSLSPNSSVYRKPYQNSGSPTRAHQSIDVSTGFPVDYTSATASPVTSLGRASSRRSDKRRSTPIQQEVSSTEHRNAAVIAAAAKASAFAKQDVAAISNPPVQHYTEEKGIPADYVPARTPNLPVTGSPKNAYSDAASIGGLQGGPKLERTSSYGRLKSSETAQRHSLSQYNQTQHSPSLKKEGSVRRFFRKFGEKK